MKVEITIPDGIKGRVETAMTTLHGYQEKITKDGKEIDNPQTKAEFMQEVLAKKVREAVKRYESDIARKAAEDEIGDELNVIV
jgi:hypothetical protein